MPDELRTLTYAAGFNRMAAIQLRHLAESEPHVALELRHIADQLDQEAAELEGLIPVNR